MTERLPLVLTSLTHAVTYVRSEEYSDIRAYGAPDVIRHLMGFGKAREEALAGPIAGMMARFFFQSVDMIADAIGLTREAERNTVHEVAVATQPIESPIGTLEPGQVAAQRFAWQATVQGEPVIEARVNWFMGEEGFDRPWGFGPEGERYELEVRGDPDFAALIRGAQPEDFREGLERNRGLVATAQHCVNAIPYLCRAEPGIHTYLNLPLIAGRAAPALQRTREEA